jgi:hypothetical protein
VRKALAAALLAALLCAGCLKTAPAAPDDKFPDDPNAGATFPVNATGGDFALHLDVAKEGRVAYRVLAREGARVDACLMPGRDAELWWANRTVPVEACKRGAILAQQGTDLPAGPWTLAIRAYGCPDGGCSVTAVVLGAVVADAAQGPPSEARLEAIDLGRCAVC